MIKSAPRLGPVIVVLQGTVLLGMLAGIASVGVAVAHGAGPGQAKFVADSGDVQRRQQPMKAEMDRKWSEQMRQFEAKTRAMKGEQQRLYQKALDDLAKVRAGLSSPKSPPFDPAIAPAPVECLKSYIAAARAANSMEQVLPFLPMDEQRILKQRQANYDPKQAASNREWFKKQNPSIKEDELTFLSNPPFTNELDRNKRIAKKILDILSVKTEGNKTFITVSTNSGGTFNGEDFPYGKADVELTGEGNYWRFSSYKDSIVFYKNPPQTP